MNYTSADSQLLSRLSTPALRRSPRFSLGTVPIHTPVSWSAPRGRRVPRPQPQRQGQGFQREAVSPGHRPHLINVRMTRRAVADGVCEDGMDHRNTAGSCLASEILRDMQRCDVRQNRAEASYSACCTERVGQGDVGRV